MEEKNRFIDLPQQKRGNRQQTKQKVIKGITYSLIVIMFIALSLLCVCLFNGGKIELFGGFYFSAKSLIQDLFILAFAAMIVNAGGLPKMWKHRNTKTQEHDNTEI